MKMEKLVWELFQKTGDIKYYLLAKRMEECDQDEDSGCKGTGVV